MTQTVQSTDPTPGCFGKRWDSNEVMCAGGLDPTYTNKLDGTHRRDRCKWYPSCASRTTTSRLGAMNQPQAPQMQVPQMPGMVPLPQQPAPWGSMGSLASGALQGAMNSLARHQDTGAGVKVPVRFGPPHMPSFQPYPQPVPQAHPQQYAYPYQQPQPQSQPQYPYAYPQQQGFVPPGMAMMPQMVAQNYQAPGAQMPAYLTVPEPVVMGSHWAYRLVHSVLRSMLKASGHTLANFFDYTPMNQWLPPQLPPGQGTGTNGP